jgi:hypothetical protein
MTPVTHTSLFTREAFAALGAPDLVYVRPIKAADILASTPVSVTEGFSFDPDQTLYAVHRADGERLAVLTDPRRRSPPPWRTNWRRFRFTRVGAAKAAARPGPLQSDEVSPRRGSRRRAVILAEQGVDGIGGRRGAQLLAQGRLAH